MHRNMFYLMWATQQSTSCFAPVCEQKLHWQCIKLERDAECPSQVSGAGHWLMRNVFQEGTLSTEISSTRAYENECFHSLPDAVSY